MRLRVRCPECRKAVAPRKGSLRQHIKAVHARALKPVIEAVRERDESGTWPKTWRNEDRLKYEADLTELYISLLEKRAEEALK